jgi:hypothetical protein
LHVNELSFKGFLHRFSKLSVLSRTPKTTG